MTYNPNRALLKLTGTLLMLILLGVYAIWITHTDIDMDFLARRQAPSVTHWFGTDSLGRDLWDRTFQGMATSLQIGLISAFTSGLVALTMAGLSTINKGTDYLVRGVIDALLALPHLLLLILILRVRETDYVMLAQRMGISRLYCWRHHYLPMLLPQWFVGTLLMFPHSVLHSAALSFLGFGLAPHEASLGILLSDALRYLSTGAWWLAFFPGLVLVGLVLLFDQFAKALQQLWLRIA